ncbi:hypothetical protein FA95DRAFT_1648762 [Auriscalpium vulgare]|uniref:Uncharacterized protein n=1 Tax=Auriscalpium vulgare TaxID=40419 RepID=A0ACB8R9K8_9AGAM|nr:hypothetical protein FA95DRAFT_1648762 [Auriscalpium vulgare]
MAYRQPTTSLGYSDTIASTGTSPYLCSTSTSDTLSGLRIDRADGPGVTRFPSTQANWVHDTSGDSTLRGIPAALGLSEEADELEEECNGPGSPSSATRRAANARSPYSLNDTSRTCSSAGHISGRRCTGTSGAGDEHERSSDGRVTAQSSAFAGASRLGVRRERHGEAWNSCG